MILMQGQQPSGFNGNPRMEFASMLIREKRGGYSTGGGGGYAKPQCSKFFGILKYNCCYFTHFLTEFFSRNFLHHKF
jgi:hypothetical protein